MVLLKSVELLVFSGKSVAEQRALGKSCLVLLPRDLYWQTNVRAVAAASKNMH